MKKKILLRFDDICPTMNWEQWEKAKQLMDENMVVALLGVIPECKDSDLLIDAPRSNFWEYIKNLQDAGFTIAMHGYQHVFEIKADGLVTRNKISEFAGLPYKKQLEKIRKGKEILNSHGIETDVFFAPAHSYDRNTIKALREAGFKYVSDGLGYRPYYLYGIKLLPCRPNGIFKRKKGDLISTAVFHAHEWVRDDKKKDWITFQKLVKEHSDEMVAFNDISDWKCSSPIIQRIYEHVYIFTKNNVYPLLIKVRGVLR